MPLIDATAMGIAMQAAMDAVPAVNVLTPEEMTAYRERLMVAMASGIAGWVSPSVASVAEHTSMKLAFQTISWAQFAIFDSFEDDSKRVKVEPSFRPALVLNSMLAHGDQTPRKSFVFTSKVYADITTIGGGFITGVAGVYRDAKANWFPSEIKGLILIDSSGVRFTIVDNDQQTFTVAGDALVPSDGAYSLSTGNPSYMVAMCSYKDKTMEGGHGTVKFEASFDGGNIFQTVLDTASGIDHTGGTLLITDPGPHYCVRITLTNDDEGNGAIFTDFLVATDPSPWRF